MQRICIICLTQLISKIINANPCSNLHYQLSDDGENLTNYSTEKHNFVWNLIISGNLHEP